MYTAFSHSVPFLLIVSFLGFSAPAALSSDALAAPDVKAKGKNGFSIVIKKKATCDSKALFSSVIQPVRWWNPAHTYSGKSKNLSMNFQKSAFIETLPGGGFVRHMEIVFHHPNKKMIRLTGGLGPLQEMGVHGAMTLKVEQGTEPNNSAVTLTYNVSGFAEQRLDQIAPVVDKVLTEQMERLVKNASKEKESVKSIANPGQKKN